MKKWLVFVFWLVFQFYGTVDPKLVEAQGFGLRCDTPHCRYVPIYRGRFVGDGRHDYSPYGPYGYGDYAPYPDSAYSRGGTTIINPAPGTALKVERKEGGFLCSLLNFCSEEKVDFSTAPVAAPTSKASSTTPEPKSVCDGKTTCVRVSGGSPEANSAVKDALRKKMYVVTEQNNFDYDLHVTDKVTSDTAVVEVELKDRNGNRTESKGTTHFRMEGIESAISQSAALMLAATEAVSKLKY